MTKTEYPFDWVDAFTDQPFGGNGCSVVYDQGELSSSVCLSYTKETGLVECTFVGPSDVADVKVRYFLAEREIPFAGHPTIATVASLLDRGLFDSSEITLETGAGLISISADLSQTLPTITMTQIAPVFGPECPKQLVADVVSLSADDILETPQVVSTGLPFCVTLLKDHAAMARATLDVRALELFRKQVSYPNGDLMEPYLIVRGGATPEGQTFSRLLLAPPNPPEDPFTGSATGCAAAYLWSRGLIETPSYVAEQGNWIGRPGKAQVDVLGSPDDVTGIRVSGSGVVVMSGTLRL